MLNHLRRFARNDQGSLTIEFMIWVPVIMLWLSFSVAYYDANKNRNDAAKAAYTISDLVSRQVEVSDPFFVQIAALQNNLLPRTSGDHAFRVTSIEFQAAETEDEEDLWLVQWSTSTGAFQGHTDDTLDTSLFPPIADTETIILTEVSVPFAPIMANVGINNQIWFLPVVTRPRFVSAIVKTDEPVPTEAEGGEEES